MGSCEKMPVNVRRECKNSRTSPTELNALIDEMQLQTFLLAAQSLKLSSIVGSILGYYDMPRIWFACAVGIRLRNITISRLRQLAIGHAIRRPNQGRLAAVGCQDLTIDRQYEL